ncbi:MAG: hypothetical protein OEY14_14840 [Myxococcales bacterium]|nr:hypothetical protein [Myxococcales bacterium]
MDYRVEIHFEEPPGGASSPGARRSSCVLHVQAPDAGSARARARSLFRDYWAASPRGPRRVLGLGCEPQPGPWPPPSGAGR